MKRLWMSGAVILMSGTLCGAAPAQTILDAPRAGVVSKGGPRHNDGARSRSAGQQERGSQREVTLTVLYDNLGSEAGLETAWGFAVLIETSDHTVLFDAGGDGRILLANMSALGKNPRRIEAVIISHPHADHFGGLNTLLEMGLRPPIYLPEGFRSSVADGFSGSPEIRFTTEGQEILPGIRVTGRVAGGIAEQGVILDTVDGPVLLTGCSHPGLIPMIDQARRIMNREITEVLGGFHLAGTPAGRMGEIVDGVRARGVARIGPTHCSGTDAMATLEASFGEAFVRLGVGQVRRYSWDHGPTGSGLGDPSIPPVLLGTLWLPGEEVIQ